MLFLGAEGSHPQKDSSTTAIKPQKGDAKEMSNFWTLLTSGHYRSWELESCLFYRIQALGKPVSHTVSFYSTLFLFFKFFYFKRKRDSMLAHSRAHPPTRASREGTK